MLSNVKYDTIKKRFKFREEVTGRSARPLVKLLKSLGFDCDEKSTKISKIGALKDLDCDALVYFKNVRVDSKEEGGHWMVWDHKQKSIRDPEGWQSGTTFKIKNFRRVQKIK